MLVACKPLSIGKHTFQRGDVVSADVQRLLPAGRTESLKAHRWVEEISDEKHISDTTDTLLSRITVLEARVKELEHFFEAQVDSRRQALLKANKLTEGDLVKPRRGRPPKKEAA